MTSLATVKTWDWIHKWTSLVCTAFMLLLCITGLPLIFHEEIDHLLGYEAAPPASVEVAWPASVNDIVAAAGARKPADAVQFLVRDPHEPNVWFVRLGETVNAPEASAFYAYDARTGEFLNEYPLGEGVMYVLLRLHVDMFAGLPGILFLGFMGVLLIVSLISGVVLYGPFMRKLPFGTVRHRRHARIKWLDIHNLLGIVTLMWLTVVTATGVINTLAIPIFGHWQSTQLAEMTSSFRARPFPSNIVSVDTVLDAARAAEPEMELSFLAFPGNDFASPHHFTAFMQGTTPWTEKLLKPVLIDARSGSVVAKRELPWYVTALLVSQPLHFGDYGGLPLKILWALLDVLAIVVLATGLYLWIARREQPVDAGIVELDEEAELV